MDHLNPSDDTAAGIRIISDQKKAHIQCNQTEIYMCFTYIYVLILIPSFTYTFTYTILYLYLYLYLYVYIYIYIFRYTYMYIEKCTLIIHRQ